MASEAPDETQPLARWDPEAVTRTDKQVPCFGCIGQGYWLQGRWDEECRHVVARRCRSCNGTGTTNAATGAAWHARRQGR